ncbi:uncharacterized protein LOC144102435 [Amblyomma americanum]
MNNTAARKKTAAARDLYMERYAAAYRDTPPESAGIDLDMAGSSGVTPGELLHGMLATTADDEERAPSTPPMDQTTAVPDARPPMDPTSVVPEVRPPMDSTPAVPDARSLPSTQPSERVQQQTPLSYPGRGRLFENVHILAFSKVNVWESW